MLREDKRMALLECPKGTIDLVLDTDAYNEVDDQFAISYALHAEKINLQALYAAPFHNGRSTGPADGMEKSYHEILKLLRLAGEERPVLRGSTAYLPDEQTPVISEAAEDLCRRALAHSSENPLYVVAIGAITNVASALLMNPVIAERMVLVWLGFHALHWHDNLEFNCMQDVAAARVVTDSGVPMVILPCRGVVDSLTTTGPELRYWLQGKNPLCDYLVAQTVEEAESYAAGRVWSRVIWDIASIAWLVDDEGRMMDSELIPTPIPQYDHHVSRDGRRHLCRYVYHVDRDAIFGDLFARLTCG